MELNPFLKYNTLMLKELVLVVCNVVKGMLLVLADRETILELYLPGFSFNIQHKIVNAFEAGDNRKAVILDFKDWAAKQVLLMVKGMKILGTLIEIFKKKSKCCRRFKLD
jgi:hypothetical protein